MKRIKDLKNMLRNADDPSTQSYLQGQIHALHCQFCGEPVKTLEGSLYCDNPRCKSKGIPFKEAKLDE